MLPMHIFKCNIFGNGKKPHWFKFHDFKSKEGSMSQFLLRVQGAGRK